MAWGVFYRPEVEWDQPRFKVPLSSALLSDPAFSSDPRSHPHFNADLAPRSPTRPPRQRLPRKTTMKALVRRLTTPHSLDRIDELDETDPFGTNYHHDGPYEAIASTHAEPRANVHHSRRAFNPRSLHPTQHPALPRVPSIHGEKGLSLHLEPGQILQHNSVYTSHISKVTSTPNHLPRQSNAPAIVTQPNLSRSHSLPSSQIRLPQNAPERPLNDLGNRPSSLPPPPSQRYLRDNIPDSPLHHDRHAAPYVSSQTTMTVFPPPRHASRLHDPRLSPPSLSRKARMMGDTASDAGHESVHSLDSSHTFNSTNPRSPSIQNMSSEPPRIRYLPKRLVMPAPLQPQRPEPQFRFPPAELMVWKDECPGDRTEGMDPEGRPVVYHQGPRLLRKKSSAFPGELPIPHHVPMLQDDAVPQMRDTPTQIEGEAETTKEKKRRRRLSKRKSDIPPLTLSR